MERFKKIPDNVLLKPVDEKSSEDVNLLNIQEFRRENIREQFKEVEENKDFFAYTSEDDSKYDYLRVKNMFNSKLMFKSLLWSNFIAALYTLHRYYRIQNFKYAFLSGSKLFMICFVPIWGSLEIRPHLMMWYYSRFLDKLAYDKQMELNQKYYLENLTKEHEEFEKKLGIRIPISEKQTISIILSHFEYENYILKNYGYETNKLKTFVKEKEDIYKKDLDEKELFADDEDEEDKIDYDFSIVNKMKLAEECQVSILDYFKFEKLGIKNIMNNEKLQILSKDQLSNNSNKERLLNDVIKAEKYLKGYFDDHLDDPDFKLI
jgi:hypothetical protein